MLISGNHAAQIERESRGVNRFFWPGVILNPIYFAPPSRVLSTRQEQPWHPPSFFLPGIQAPHSSAIAFKAVGFHPPYSSIGLKLRGSSPTTVLAPGRKGYHIIPFDCSIARMVLLADQPGSAVLDIYRCTSARMLAGQPPGPSDSLVSEAAFRPTLSSAQSALDFTLSFWNTALKRGDVICIELLSATAITALTMTLLVERNNQP